MVEAFKFPRKGKYFLPIIPNLYELKDKLEGIKRNPYERTIKEWPQYNAENLLKLSPKIESRIKKMIELTYEKMTDSKEVKNYPVTQKLIENYYRENIFTRFFGSLGNSVLKFLFQTNKNKIAKRASKSLIEWILKDLEEKKLIK
jgi:hypothetical protein